MRFFYGSYEISCCDGISSAWMMGAARRPMDAETIPCKISSLCRRTIDLEPIYVAKNAAAMMRAMEKHG
jgi:hypothetical protein